MLTECHTNIQKNPIMKIRFLHTLFLTTIALFFFSCSNQQGTPVHKSISGKPGELVVVISKENWANEPGKLIRDVIAQPQQGLPQEEPLFTLTDVPKQAFKDIFKSTRNIITTNISSSVEKPGVVYRDNVWASPQATVTINAKTPVQFVQIFNKNSDKIISYLLNREKKRLMETYKRIHENTVLNTLRDKYGMTMLTLPGFKVAEEYEDFLWLKYETPEISQGIFVYWFDYNSDSIFTAEYLLHKRNELFNKFVPGQLDGTYMTTEMEIEPVFNIFEHNGNYAAEMRGLWKVYGDFMGGPYVLLAELDASRQRVVVADGFVYAPSKDKRNLLRQVEAMIYSLEFNDQEKNDKINSEIKMGN